MSVMIGIIIGILIRLIKLRINDIMDDRKFKNDMKDRYGIIIK